jgi:hypothetical protein
MPYWGKARLCTRCGKRKHWGAVHPIHGYLCKGCWNPGERKRYR